MNFMNFLSTYTHKKGTWVFNRYCFEPTEQFGEFAVITILFSNSWVFNVFPFVRSSLASFTSVSMKTNMACHISKTKDVTAIKPLQPPLMVSPEGIQDGDKRTLLLPIPQLLQFPSTVYPGGDSRWRRAGYWSQVAEVHVKIMISVSPDSCIFP